MSAFYVEFPEGPRYASPVPTLNPGPPEFHQVSPRCAFCQADAHFECDRGCGRMVCPAHGKENAHKLILCPVCRADPWEAA
jgi:hypothetical protein